MRLSLAWIFSHIAQNPFTRLERDFKQGEFFDAIGQTIAEIECVERIEYPLDTLFLAQVLKLESHNFRLFIAELDEQIELPVRDDLSVGQYCLVQKHAKRGFAYVTLAQLHAEKEGFVGPVWAPEGQRAGGWKQDIPAWDYLLTFDNKSLSHRPDLWGHRGFAREVAALYDYQLIPEDFICAPLAIRHFSHRAPAVAGNRYGLVNQSPQTCSRIAGISLMNVTVCDSLPWMALRLAAVDARPINSSVDITNYVMFDLGQPLHAFDQKALSGDELFVTHARAEEKLELLDGTVCALTETDTVLRDDRRVLSLAGIMGGRASSITAQTDEIFIESACFNAHAIRLSALHHKLRTQSSTRFEKSLDPHQNTAAILRYIKIMADNGLSGTPAQALLSVGDLAPEKKVSLTHQQIIDKIGVPIAIERVQSILMRLGFGVLVHETPQAVTTYTVTVPSFRATKDIDAAHDIIEEVARFIGFNNLPLQLPLIPTKPRNHALMHTRRATKYQCAFTLGLHEVYNYALYDEDFLKHAGIDLAMAYTLKNPVSQQATRLVTSLIAHLIKNVVENSKQETHVGFFEMATIWPVIEGTIEERRSLSGIWYDRDHSDFYEKKELLQRLFQARRLPVLWQKPERKLAPWYHPHQTAELVVDQKIIGYAGMAHPAVIKRTLGSGSAFIFEIDADVLCELQSALPAYHEISKFQSVSTDLSMFVPDTISVDALEEAVARADARIYELYTLDYLERSEHAGQRALTVRYKAVDQEKTLSKEEIEQLRACVEQAVTQLGVTVR